MIRRIFTGFGGILFIAIHKSFYDEIVKNGGTSIGPVGPMGPRFPWERKK